MGRIKDWTGKPSHHSEDLTSGKRKEESRIGQREPQSVCGSTHMSTKLWKEARFSEEPHMGRYDQPLVLPA
jgi:hypothetical protein